MITVNQRPYRVPAHPTVVVCVNGCEPDCIAQPVAHGQMPWLRQGLAEGAVLLAECVIPSFTNPNNLSIMTGAPPSVHGICGNCLFDAASNTEVLMNDPKSLRAPSVLAALAEAGRTAAVVTAKDKLRELLGHGMKGICFSAEKAGTATWAENGVTQVVDLVHMSVPNVDSAELPESPTTACESVARRSASTAAASAASRWSTPSVGPASQACRRPRTPRCGRPLRLPTPTGRVLRVLRVSRALRALPGGNNPNIVTDDADLDAVSTLPVQRSTKPWRRSQGARLLAGNRRNGALYAPTVLDRVRPDMTPALQEPLGRSHRSSRSATSTKQAGLRTAPPAVCRRRCARADSTTSPGSWPHWKSAR